MRGKTSAIVLASLGSLAFFLVACGEVDSTKTADDGTIVAGQEASFTITVVAEPAVPENPFCSISLESSGEVTIASFGFDTGDLCQSSGNINDPLPAGIDWDFEILQNDGTGSCAIVPGPAVDQETLQCDFSDLDQPAGTVGTAGVFSVRVFGQSDVGDCPRTLTNTATVSSGFTGSGFAETETPTDTIEVVCPAGTVIEPPDIDPIGDITPDVDISATPSIVFPTPEAAVPDGEGPSVGTGDSGLADDRGERGLVIAIVATGLGLAALAVAVGAIRFARR